VAATLELDLDAGEAIVMIAIDIRGVSVLAHAHQLRWLLLACRTAEGSEQQPAFDEIEKILDKAVLLAANGDQKPSAVGRLGDSPVDDLAPYFAHGIEWRFAL